MDDTSWMIMKSVLWPDMPSCATGWIEQSYSGKHSHSESGYSQCYSCSRGFMHSRLGRDRTHSYWGR